MSFKSGQVQGVESKISIFLFAVIFLIGVGIFVKQMHWNMERFGLTDLRGSLAQAAEKQTPESKALGAVSILGFTALSDIETYNSSNLFEKINGKAPFYIETGFKQLFSQRFINESDSSVWLEILLYDMGGVKNAFSVYSTQRRLEAENIADFDIGYTTSNSLYFVKGKYYIEITGSLEEKELMSGIIKAGKKISNELKVTGTEKIEEINWFPKENLVPKSFTLSISGAFSFDKFTDVFSAKYQFDQENVTAFFSKMENQKDATEIAQKYKDFLIDNGATLMVSRDYIKDSVILDYYGTTEVIFNTDSFVAGVHQAENRQLAMQTAKMLYEKLKEISKGTNVE